MTTNRGQITPVARPLPAAVARELAVAVDVDPRTVVKVHRGAPVRSPAARRAHAALLEAGYQLPEEAPESAEESPE